LFSGPAADAGILKCMSEVGKRRARVILTKGLPGSGKSTWARQQLEQQPGKYKRINKDDLRRMLDDGRHTDRNEKVVEHARDALILLAIEQGFDVIIDDTNLAVRHERHITQLVGSSAKVEIKDFTDVPIDECIRRDLRRDASVGERVIRQMYARHLAPQVVTPPYDPALPDCIVVDLDGTLALITDRNVYDAANCERDRLNQPVADIAERYAHVVLCSGRQDVHRPETERWLAANGVRYDELHMRAAGDQRTDSIVKEELYRNNILGRWNVLFVLDDRQQVVDMWRRVGLTCMQVAPGDF
jgi:predicted kinase